MGCKRLTYYQYRERALGKNLFFLKGGLEKRYAEEKKRIDYYPFGFQMVGRSFSSNQYKYGFNGMEKDDELYNSTGSSYDYGFRIYNSRLARFLSVDPLTNKYPMLTPYQFASNTPIQAIDLDGLEAYFIHGTMSNNKRWHGKKGNKLVSQLLRLTNNSHFDRKFEWGGAFNYGNGPFNDIEDRTKAAQKLVDRIMENRVEGEDITLIGHSHGGNVAIQAIPILKAALEKAGANDVKINLITIATPAVNEDGNLENPETHSGILNSHIHIYNRVDGVQVGMSNVVDGETYERTYDYLGTKNIELPYNEVVKMYTKIIKNSGSIKAGIPASETKVVDKTGAHSVDAEHPEFIKKNIDNGTIPKK